MGESRGWGLLAGLALVSVALFAAYSGVLSILLPQQAAILAPDDKVGALAIVTSLSFAVTALAQPLFGALSDRTRSRWGRRLPWMVGGALVGGAALGAMGGAQSIAVLAVLWVVAQFVLNGVDIASTVYLVDAFPAERRGRVAGVLGISAIAGGAAGAVLAGRFAAPAAAYWVLAALVIVAVLIFAVVFRRAEPAMQVRERFSLGAFLRGFWVDPRQHPDFVWVLLWRIVFSVAYGVVHGYLFYILTDYIGVGERDAAAIVGQVTVIGGVGVVLAVLVGGAWSDRVGRRKPFLIAAAALVAVADLVPLALPTVTGMMVVAGALGVALGLAIACGLALAGDVLPDPEGSAARGLGMFNFGTNLGQAAAPLLAAAVISGLGGYPALFVVSAVLMVAAAGMVLAIRGAR